MKKRTCYRLMIASLIGVIAATTMLFIQIHKFTKVVYAKSTESSLEEELYCDSLEMLAICVQAEAGDQLLTGRRMVADVILNRVDDPDWPDTIEGVITERNQFTSYWDGGMDKVQEPDELTIKAVQMELKQRSWPGLYYFTAGGYGKYGTPWKKVGDHYFCTK
ncbi:MAG: cell wall hydrolase [Lachnospiraceae bacterium]|nr:cell wall hydrolase [Lachnospiraceae bacterium]